MTAMARQLIRKSIPQLTQGSTLTLRSQVPCSVVFQPEWRDDGVVSMEENSAIKFDIREKELRTTSLGRVAPHICMDLGSNDGETNGTTPHPTITIQVPEKINLQCDLSAKQSSVSIPGKIEGDVVIKTNGWIHAKKLRGHTVDLQAHRRIVISDLIEAASLRVHTSDRFRAKQVHCAQADIQVREDDPSTDPAPEDIWMMTAVHNDPDDEKSLVDISALFISTGNDAGSGASIHIHPRSTSISHRAVRMKSNHGPVQVQVGMMGNSSSFQPTVVNEFSNMPYPLVELGGVNGQCEVSIFGSPSSETMSHHNDDWVSCQVHIDSLSTGSVSLVTADCGNVAITVDRKVVADLRLLSHHNESKETLLESGCLLAEEEDEEMICTVLKQLGSDEKDTDDSLTTTKIQLLSPAFSKKSNSFSTNAIEYVQAVVENKSAEPDSRFDRQSGKVRIDGAGSQALSRFSSSSSADDHAEERPLFAVVGVGNIVMETVSWFGAIARRYGLEESERELGRTASRRGRLLVPPPTTRSS